MIKSRFDAFIIIYFNPKRKYLDFKNYNKERQAGEANNPGDYEPKNCRATKLN